jgi:deoxyribonuclease V
MAWPATADDLADQQKALAAAEPPPWRPEDNVVIGGCFVCSPRGKRGDGAAGDPLWAAANAQDATAVTSAEAGAPYRRGLLALREGPALETVVRALEGVPEVLLVDGTGRDHPRGAGLALHLGSVLDLPTIGVTHRPLVAEGTWPDDEPGAHSPLVLAGVVVGYWLRTRAGVRPLAVHAAWRTDPETAVETVLASLSGYRSPEPLRRARRAAREARGEIMDDVVDATIDR